MSHTSPTPVGLAVTAEAVISEGGDKMCTFSVKAHDASGTMIGEGTHQRVLVNSEKFMSKARSKMAKPMV